MSAAAASLCAGVPGFSLGAEASAASTVIVRPDGAVAVPGFEVPLSIYMSDAARRRFIEQGTHPAVLSGATIAEVRKSVDDWYRPKVERAKKLYSVDIAQQTLSGVRMAVVTPSGGASERNRRHVLINLHGGGFATGAGNGGLAESIPVAALGRIQVLSIDYRMAPEHRFPAATEDVVAVYRELLKTHSPTSIGLYGCSAGGLLTSQVVARLQKEKLPAPGAIGIFCLGADALAGGDSRYLATSLEVSLGRPLPPPAAQPNPPLLPMAYLDGVDLRDPLVSPVFSRDTLKEFPPTLLISGSRDLGLSSILHTHAELTAVGADARLHVWEGMGHNFLVEMDLPESRAAYDVIVRHFDRHLR
jgi:monoterpene epsilon-lactone hydrolase